MYTFEQESSNEKFYQRLVKNYILENFEGELNKLIITLNEDVRELPFFNGEKKIVEKTKVMKIIKTFDFEGFDKYGGNVNTTKCEILYESEKFEEDMCYAIDIYFVNSNNCTNYTYYVCHDIEVYPLAINGEFIGVLH